MTKALDAAIRAAESELDALTQPGTVTLWSLAERTTRAALRAALPIEMPDWFVAWWSRHGNAGIFGHDAAMRRRAVAWIALRAHLLGEVA